MKITIKSPKDIAFYTVNSIDTAIEQFFKAKNKFQIFFDHEKFDEYVRSWIDDVYTRTSDNDEFVALEGISYQLSKYDVFVLENLDSGDFLVCSKRNFTVENINYHVYEEHDNVAIAA